MSAEDLDANLREALAPKDILDWFGVLTDLQHRWDLYIVRGEPIVPIGERVGVRRLLHPDRETGDPATFAPAQRNWLVLDIDSFEESGLSMDDPEAALRSLIEKYIPELRGVTFCFRPSASAYVKPGLRLHVVICADRSHTDQEFKAFLKAINSRVGRKLVDTGLADTVTPFYTAQPRFGSNSKDPAPDRSWKLVHGERDAFSLPLNLVLNAAKTKRREDSGPPRATLASTKQAKSTGVGEYVADVSAEDIAWAERQLARHLETIRSEPYPSPRIAYAELWNHPVFLLGRVAHLLGGVEAVQRKLDEAIDHRFDRVANVPDYRRNPVSPYNFYQIPLGGNPALPTLAQLAVIAGPNTLDFLVHGYYTRRD